MARLTPKQRCFCEEYLVDLNATKAASRAGFARKTARQQGARLLSKVDISDAIAGLMEARSGRTEITVDRVLKEYARVAFLDIRKAFDKDGKLLPIQDIDDDTEAAIAGLEVEALYEGTGKDRKLSGKLFKVKLASKLAALDSLAKHLGMLVERHEVAGPGGGELVLLSFQAVVDSVYGDGDASKPYQTDS